MRYVEVLHSNRPFFNVGRVSKRMKKRLRRAWGRRDGKEYIGQAVAIGRHRCGMGKER